MITHHYQPSFWVQKINRIKQQNIRDTEREAQLQRQSQATPQTQSQVAPESASRTIRMVLESDDGRHASVYASEGDADNVIEMMTKAKGVSAR